MLLKILFPVERLVTVIALDVLGSRMNDHVRLYVGFLGKRLSTHTAPEVLLTFRMRLEQIITKKYPFPRLTMKIGLGVPKPFSSIDMMYTVAP